MLWGIDKGGFFFLWAGELLFFFCVFERRYLSFSQLLLSLSGNFHRERRAWASISKLFYLPEWIFLCAFFSLRVFPCLWYFSSAGLLTWKLVPISISHWSYFPFFSCPQICHPKGVDVFCVRKQQGLGRWCISH